MHVTKHLLRALAMASLLLAGYATPASATITNIWGPPGELCIVSAPCGGSFRYPIRQGRAPVLDIEGQYVDLSTGLEVSGSGVTVTTTGTSSSHRLIRVSVSASAAPGVRTVKLHYAVELNGPDHFDIIVLRAGKVTAAPNANAADYFNDVNASFQGDSLDNAGVIMLPEKIGTFSVGGSQVPQVVTLTQSVGSATMASSTSTLDTVKFHFDGGPFAEAKATVLLFDKQIDSNVCLMHRTFCYTGLDNSSTNESTVHIIGPNAVSSITFPFGGSVRTGSPITARIQLVRPAATLIEVRFEVVPATSFTTAAGSGTSFNPNGVNAVKIITDQSKDATIQLVSLPAGCRDQCSGQFRTRMVNFTIDGPPYLREAPFTMLKAVPLPPPLFFLPRFK